MSVHCIICVRQKIMNDPEVVSVRGEIDHFKCLRCETLTSAHNSNLAELNVTSCEG